MCVENLSRSYLEISMNQDSIKNVSSRQIAQKFGSRINLVVEKLSRSNPKILVEETCVELLLKRYRATVEETEARFSIGGKTHKMNATR